MKVSAIVGELSGLEQKRDEVRNVLNESAYGEASIILSRELDSYNKKVDTFLDAEFDPVATVLYLGVTTDKESAEVGETIQLTVVATLGDGNTKDVTAPRLPVMLFRDYDNLADNVGYITSVDVSNFVGVGATLLITKTSTGFGVTDNIKTQGLEVSPTGNLNEFQIVDKKGVPIGVTFTTDGNEVTTDDWLIDIYWASTGTSYEVDKPYVATVDEHGLVRIQGNGSVVVTVRNGLKETTVTLQGIDNNPPEPPYINFIDPIEEGVLIHFDPSTSIDVESYNVYVDGVLTATDITTSPASVEGLVADGTTTYAFTLTTVNTVGNESEHSNEVSAIPLEAI